MKAIVIHEHGGPEMLRYEDVPEPTPGPDQVLVRVKAAGVNFADILARLGAYPPAGQPPIIPGLEAAGVVEAVGPGVGHVEPGQRVVAWTRRSYAELVVSPGWAVQPAPATLSFEELAAIPVAFGTAWHALVTCARVQPGERVLVHAVGSGVGSAALQLARLLGAWVVATAGQDWKLERARALGADATVNYQTQDLAEAVARLTGGEGVEVALEGVGRATFEATLRSVASGGRVVIYGSPSGPRVELDTRLAIFRNLTLYGMAITSSPLFPESVAALWREAPRWFEQGVLKPVIDRVYPLAEAAAAHERLRSREHFGKLVLRVEDSAGR